MTNSDLSIYDRQVMAYIANPDDESVKGEVIPGAALWSTVEYLRNKGYLKIVGSAYRLTGKGQAVLRLKQ